MEAQPSSTPKTEPKSPDAGQYLDEQTGKIFQACQDETTKPQCEAVFRQCMEFLDGRDRQATTKEAKADVARLRFNLLCNVLANEIFHDPALVERARAAYRDFLSLEGPTTRAMGVMTDFADILAVQQSRKASHEFLAEESKTAASDAQRDWATYFLAESHALHHGDDALALALFDRLSKCPTELVRRGAPGWAYELRYVKAGLACPAFSAPDASGKAVPVDLTGRPTVIRVVRTTCAFCTESPQELRTLREKYSSDKLRIIYAVIEEGGPADKKSAPADAPRLPYDVIVMSKAADDPTTSDELATKLHATVTPSTYLVDRRGVIVATSRLVKDDEMDRLLVKTVE